MVANRNRHNRPGDRLPVGPKIILLPLAVYVLLYLHIYVWGMR